MNLTDNEIIKALELCAAKRIETCRNCPLVEDRYCKSRVKRNALDLINRQKEEIKRLSDKIDQRDEMMANLGIELEAMRGAANSYKMHYEKAQAEIERWRANYTLPKEGFFNVLCGALVYTKTHEEYNQFRRTIKAEAIKEYAERLRRTISISDAQKVYFDNLVKEMVGEDDEK